MKNIYLAGPDVFLPKPTEKGKRLKQLCLDYGFIGHFPLDNEITGSNPLEIAANIRQANKDLIQKCDIIIANVSPFRGPEPDSGTVWEIGYAQGLNKKVLAYSFDMSTLKEKTQVLLKLKNTDRDSIGMKIEDFGLTHNLMFADIVVSDSFEGCLKTIKSK